MIEMMKGLYNALSQAAFLSHVASRYSDPEEKRAALMKAMGVLAEPAKERPEAEEAELAAA